MQKKSLMENRPLAWVLFVLIALVAVLGIGGIKVKSLGKEAVQYYYNNIDADMQLRVAAAQVIVQQGEANLDKNDATLKSAQSALKAIQKASTPREIFAANTDLTASVGQLYETLRLAIGDEKGSVLQTTYAEFKSRLEIISHSYDGYTQLAQKAQDAVTGFPASLIAKLAGMAV